VTLRPAPLAALAALACLAVLSGCLGSDDEAAERRPIRAHVLTLYTSQPTEGPSAATAREVAAGQRQALADAGSRAGRYRLKLVTLSASKPGEGNWDPGQVAENADRAAHDPRAIAYLGELNLGASAISVPVTNNAGLLQVSPTDGLASLTEAPPRSAAGPERYFPSGRRTFLRLVPDDLVEARLIVDRMAALGVERPALIVGTGIYARELAAEIAADARRAGIPVVDTNDLRDDPDTVLDAAGELAGAPADSQADAVVLALARDRYTSQLLAGLRRALPQAVLLTGDGVLVGQPLLAAPGSEPASLEAVAPEPPRGPDAAPSLRILDRVARHQGPQLATPASLWGYESVRVTLDAIRAAQRNGGPANRAGVIHAALERRVRRSPIGTYEVRRNGSVEGLPMALYKLRGDRFEYVRTLF
jgi:branched-chain amino acid transport system substrate-binding protein